MEVSPHGALYKVWFSCSFVIYLVYILRSRLLSAGERELLEIWMVSLSAIYYKGVHYAYVPELYAPSSIIKSSLEANCAQLRNGTIEHQDYMWYTFYSSTRTKVRLRQTSVRYKTVEFQFATLTLVEVVLKFDKRTAIG